MYTHISRRSAVLAWTPAAGPPPGDAGGAAGSSNAGAGEATAAGLAPGDAGGAGDGDDGEGGTKKRKRRGAKQSGQAWRRREAARREVPTSDAHGAG